MRMGKRKRRRGGGGVGRYALAPLCPRTDVFEPILTTVSPVIVPAQVNVYHMISNIDH